MGWTKLRSGKPKVHTCDKPYFATTEDYAGDVIRCNDCGQVWICVSIDHGYPPYTSTPIMNWEKETVIGKCNDR